MDRPGLSEVLAQIIEISPSLHSATTFPAKVLGAIARHASRRVIQRSAETGSGASTLLFSHRSTHHTVFAFDGGSGSVRNVRSSSLLRENVVHFVEGPTQQTLPKQHFEEKFQVVLLDGPHAYPFPDLEYYFLYPHLDTGGLLILDDIHIPTINHLFRFLRRDAMFDLDEVVHTTAFFTRTEAATFNPQGDGWWEQSANRKTLYRYQWKEKVKPEFPIWHSDSNMVLPVFSRMQRLYPVRQATTASKGTHGQFLSSAEPVSLLLSRLVAHPSDPPSSTPRFPARTGRP